MNKRKFKPENVYKLIRILVIIFTIGALTLAYLNNKSYHYYLDESNKEYAPCYQKYPNYIKDQSESDKWINCVDNSFAHLDSQLASTSLNYFYQSLIVGIIVPVIFLGGTWLFKYLFPVVKE